MKKQALTDINTLEKQLVKLYEMGDRLVYLLSKLLFNSNEVGFQNGQTAPVESSGKGSAKPAKHQDFQKEWLRVELNFALAKNLFFEF